MLLPGELARYLFTDARVDHLQVQQKFEEITRQQSNALNFRQVLRAVNAKALEQILYSDTDAILESGREIIHNDQLLAEKFTQLADRYHYFIRENYRNQAVREFIIYHKVCSIYAAFIEFPNQPLDTEVINLQAFTLVLIFGGGSVINSSKRIDQFILEKCEEQPRVLSEILTIKIPINHYFDNENLNIDISKWRHFILDHGIQAFNIFTIAGAINQMLNRNPENYKEALRIYNSLQYPRSKENIELSLEAKSLQIRKKYFNRALDIEARRKQSDMLPNRMVRKKYPSGEYHFIKLPITDVKTYFIGKYLNNCLKIAAKGEQCIIDAKTLNSCGISVLLFSKKGGDLILYDGTINYAKYKIVGGAFFGITITGNLLLDCWDSKNPDKYEKKTYTMLTTFGELVTNDPDYPDIVQVRIGTEGSLPSEFDETCPYREYLKEGTDYGDACEQNLVYINESKQAEIFEQLSMLIERLRNREFLPKEQMVIFTAMVLQEELCTSYYFLKELQKIFENEQTYQLLRSHFIEQYGNYKEDPTIESSHYYWSIIFFLNNHGLLGEETLNVLSKISKDALPDIYKNLISHRLDSNVKLTVYANLFIQLFAATSDELIEFNTFFEITVHDLSRKRLILICDTSVDNTNLFLKLCKLNVSLEIYIELTQLFAENLNAFNMFCIHFNKLLFKELIKEIIPIMIEFAKKDNELNMKSLVDTINLLKRKSLSSQKMVTFLNRNISLINDICPIFNSIGSILIANKMIPLFLDNFQDRKKLYVSLPSILLALQAKGQLTEKVLIDLLNCKNVNTYKCINYLINSPSLTEKLLLSVLNTKMQIIQQLNIFLNKLEECKKHQPSTFLLEHKTTQNQHFGEFKRLYYEDSPTAALAYLESVSFSSVNKKFFA